MHITIYEFNELFFKYLSNKVMAFILWDINSLLKDVML